jgi:hypothetical protein
MISVVPHDTPAVRPEVKARQLLCDLLPRKALQEFLEKDSFHYEGSVGVYRISRDAQTEIYRHGRLAASGCLQLTVFAPTYDRMLAEYLILKNDERLYWTKANIFPVRRLFDWRVLAVGLLNVALIAKLVLDYLY